MFWFGAIWFVAAYALVSFSVTKFHHYILPAMPGLAITIACFLDDLLGRRDTRLAAVTAAMGVGLWRWWSSIWLAAKNAQHFIWLFSYDYINAPKGRPWPEALDFRRPCSRSRCFRALAVAMAWRRWQRAAAVALCGVAVVFSYYLLDGYMRR